MPKTKKQSERKELRSKMDTASTRFVSLIQEMEHENSRSIQFPKNKNEICDEMLSIIKMLNEGTIPLSKVEKLEWEKFNSNFEEQVKRLRNVEKENNESDGSPNVLDYKNQTSYYIPVNVSDIIEYLNQGDMYNRVIHLMSFGLVGMKKEDYEEYSDDMDCNEACRQSEDSEY